MTLIQLPYIINIILLLPIAVPTIFNWFPTDQGAFVESEGWRKITGSIWTAIFILSIFGVYYPERFSLLLVMQVIYKSLWLLSYFLPHALKKDFAHIPSGITVSFILIVLFYPFVIPWRYLFS